MEYLDLKTLVPFQNHPFKLRDGEEKEQLLQSIKTQGAIEPLIVRPLSESEYEVVSGHRSVWRFARNSVWKDTCYRPKSDR
ncbi:MAG: ParB N-terminal domain-containing protein [Eubacteriales bacterium]